MIAGTPSVGVRVGVRLAVPVDVGVPVRVRVEVRVWVRLTVGVGVAGTTVTPPGDGLHRPGFSLRSQRENPSALKPGATARSGMVSSGPPPDSAAGQARPTRIAPGVEKFDSGVHAMLRLVTSAPETTSTMAGS